MNQPTTQIGVHFQQPATRDDLSVVVTSGDHSSASVRLGVVTIFLPTVDDLHAFGALLCTIAEEHGASVGGDADVTCVPHRFGAVTS